MFSKDELIHMPEYWMENVQNELYYALKNYMKEKNLNQTELASKLGFSKGYISQVLHGNFNHSLNKLIELSLAINKAPKIQFVDIKEYINHLDNNYSMKVIPIEVELNSDTNSLYEECKYKTA
jgi:transcriptional regulator with XRE-family HTH domain